jgi:hypothetical protein
MDNTWSVGAVYRDRGGWKAEDDQFLKYLRTDLATIANSGGIRFRDYESRNIIDPETSRRVPAYFVLVTTEGRTQFHNPWDDVIDTVSGDLYYWGDAKYFQEGRRFDAFTGNSRVIASNNLRLLGRTPEVPPFLHFTKSKIGYVRFNGLCVLTDVRQMWFEDHGQPVKNIRLLLSILDVDQVDPAWLRARALSNDGESADILVDGF